MIFFQYKPLAVYFLLFAAILAGCSSSNSASEPSGLSGSELARTHCGNCHQLPSPSLLPKKSWAEGVLPVMGLRLGFRSDTLDLYKQEAEFRDYQEGVKLGVYPAGPVLHRDDWLKLVRYYLENAPDELPAQTRKIPVTDDLTLFQPRALPGVEPLVTAFGFDSVQQTMLVGTRSGKVSVFNRQFQKTDSSRQTSAVAGLYPRPNAPLQVLTMGKMDPNDDSTGTLGPLTGLHRPVHAAYADLNRDGREDMVISQFGYRTGLLTWHEATANGFRQHVLDGNPGARITHIRDVNQDGWPDVVALLAQGDEQVVVFVNQKNGTFARRTLLRFPSVYGSSYLELADMDGDGDEDLVYTNGDNADYSHTLKPYHGVRIFLNDGQFRFRPGWFYPLHGATQALARDFDGDGDVDVAAIAYFPDFGRKPGESFVFLENAGKLRFRPRTFSAADRGRWLTMAAADVDRDGDTDLLLGSFFMSVTPTPPDRIEQWRRLPGAWLLENRSR
ncbi:FG-GAP repeat domain-containing protein [Tellurirhabdus rosea]|uniref:FG-GAP repeat domain-containing protein n=1 Tax=Tellurirhabdus rosea TaxID=2674997 RepID=UPI0022591D86|nr:VCBS repeat-containing protein [Tellurirhabdus rosea]